MVDGKKPVARTGGRISGKTSSKISGKSIWNTIFCLNISCWLIAGKGCWMVYGEKPVARTGGRIIGSKEAPWSNLPENSDFHQKFWVIGEQMFSLFLVLLLLRLVLHHFYQTMWSFYIPFQCVSCGREMSDETTNGFLVPRL